MRICIITDNDYIYQNVKEIVKDYDCEFDFFFSHINRTFMQKYAEEALFNPICLKAKDDSFYNQYDLFISLHCKQLFPSELVRNYRCINVHPGLNPYNRGWFPQVFSILNKKPLGVTIHEMDEDLDHGPIIYQEQVYIESWETSYDVYMRIQSLEIEMLKKNMRDLIDGTYTSTPMLEEGNINYKSDFGDLCRIDLNKTGTFGDFIDLLRATTFPIYDNAYFVDINGNKVYVSINLKREE